LTNSINLDVLARFAILPGAAELMEAFSVIPPGPLRASVIQHAQVIAQTYAGAPADHRMPDPIQKIGGTARVTKPLPKLPPSEGPSAEIVRRRLAGETPMAIAKALRIDVQVVYQATYDARKAGIAMPKRSDTPLRPLQSKPWHRSIDSLSPQGLNQVTLAAVSRGITAEAYMERRQLALSMALSGAGWTRIMAATGERETKVVGAWLSGARAAGYRVPYITAADSDSYRASVEAEARTQAAQAPQDTPPPLAPQDDTPAPPAASSRVFPPFETMPRGAAVAFQQAAERRGLTVQAYADLRESIVRHRLANRYPTEIAKLTGQNKLFIRDTIDAAKARGVRFPGEPDGHAEYTDVLKVVG
jgi:hypothetical protein